MKDTPKTILFSIFYLFVFLFAIAVIPSSSYPADSKSLKVSEQKWVEVMNPRGISNIDIHFNFGDLCEIEIEGRVGIINSEETEHLVIYAKPQQDTSATGTQCLSGTIFYMDIEFYADMFHLDEAHRE